MLEAHDRLIGLLDDMPRRVIACSGGIDSLLLATVSHRLAPQHTVIAHAVTAAVPAQATARVMSEAKRHGWNLELVASGEFDDERYLSNPTNRCYFCKTNLYDALGVVAAERFAALGDQAVVLSGANLDDLGEYRPGLEAAAEHGVRHPYVEAEITKSDIRAIARDLGLDYAELPASPCLASRLYTGTRVNPARLRAVELGEHTVQALTGLAVVRCRIRDDDVIVEVPADGRSLVTPDVLAEVGSVMRQVVPTLRSPMLDDRAYRPGRAFLVGHEHART